MKLTLLLNRYQTLINEIISALLILLFVYVGISKYYERSFFEAQLSYFPIINKIALQLSWLIPFINSLVAVFLLLPKTNQVGLYMTLVVLSGYTIYLVVMLITQNDLPCSCGGIIKSLSWKEQVTLNLISILLTLEALLLGKPSKLQNTKHSAS